MDFRKALKRAALITAIGGATLVGTKTNSSPKTEYYDIDPLATTFEIAQSALDMGHSIEYERAKSEVGICKSGILGSYEYDEESKSMVAKITSGTYTRATYTNGEENPVRVTEDMPGRHEETCWRDDGTIKSHKVESHSDRMTYTLNEEYDFKGHLKDSVSDSEFHNIGDRTQHKETHYEDGHLVSNIEVTCDDGKDKTESLIITRNGSNAEVYVETGGYVWEKSFVKDKQTKEVTYTKDNPDRRTEYSFDEQGHKIPNTPKREITPAEKNAYLDKFISGR